MEQQIPASAMALYLASLTEAAARIEAGIADVRMILDGMRRVTEGGGNE
jgi:hypothetical protein